MTKWEVVFDGSTNPGTVRLSNYDALACATFDSDETARLFFDLLNEMKDELLEADNRLGRVMDALREAQREGEKP